MRLDVKLVEDKLFKTRSKAILAIKSGIIYVNNKCIKKSGFMVDDNDVVEIVGEILPYVSRGGLKLEKAIKEFSIDMNGKRVLDIGSSTGGFTDCALQHGASFVVAVDVGSDQFDKDLREDKRILLLEKTDFRNIDNSLINNVDLITIDVSFISVTLLLDKISSIESKPDIMCLIKPQFECGKEIASEYKGIILNKDVHLDVVNKVISAFNLKNYGCVNIDKSPIKGGDGNIEYITLFKFNKENSININNTINKAFSNLR